MIGIQTINSWDLKNINTENVIYICPRNSNSDEDENNSIDIKKEIANTGYYIAKGSNPNNYVKLEVNAKDSESGDSAYFPNDTDKDLWRVVSVDDSGRIKLIYNKAVESNNYSYLLQSSKSTYISRENCKYGRNKKYSYNAKEYYLYPLNNYLLDVKYYSHDFSSSSQFIFESLTGSDTWTIFDILSSRINATESGYSDNSKLNYLYNSIVKKNWIDYNDYQYYYNLASGIYQLDNKNVSSKFGTITINDINSSMLFGKSYLSDIDTISGYRSYDYKYDSYSKTVYLAGISANSKVATSQFSYVYSCQEGTVYSDRLVILNTLKYYPVITLEKGVFLESDNCENNSKVGSKACPYELMHKTCEITTNADGNGSTENCKIDE